MHCGKPVGSEGEEYCPDCRGTKSRIRQGRSVWLHTGLVPGAVYRFKYKNKRRYGEIFAAEMAKWHGEIIKRWGIGEIIPIPLHPSRRKRRGYNQAELIARGLSMYTGIPYRADVLFRIKKTTPLKELDRSERRLNLRGAFAVSRKWTAPENILLTDDIYTTGSTMESAAGILKKAGVQNVYFLTISIGQGI